MQTICYVANGKMEMLCGQKPVELVSQRLCHYEQVLRDLHRQHEWKSSGTGARFMGQANPHAGHESGASSAVVTGIAPAPNCMLYTITIDGTCGIYLKYYQNGEDPEGFVFSNQSLHLFDLSLCGNRVAASVAEGGQQRHLALFTMPRGDYSIVTDGDTVEEHPSFSRDGHLVYCSTSGFGRDISGNFCGLSPRSILVYDHAAREARELFSSPDFDYIKPKEGSDGCLYFIRRPYKTEEKDGNLLQDIALAPVRVVKAVGGWLNFFTQRYAGESLRNGGKNASKAKQKSEQELFIEGNLVNVDKTLRENSERGERYPGLAPKSWELVRAETNGSLTVVKQGILDYTFLPDGGIVYSNGKHIVSLHGNAETLEAEVRMATMLAVLETGPLPARANTPATT